MIGNAEALGGDPQKTAIVGEDAGANLAVNVAMAARETSGAAEASGR
jgi:acetyl esterase